VMLCFTKVLCFVHAFMWFSTSHSTHSKPACMFQLDSGFDCVHNIHVLMCPCVILRILKTKKFKPKKNYIYYRVRFKKKIEKL
jgi:hypothetical protein